MAESTYKILAVERILLANPYGITTNEIIERLESDYGITAERKSVLANIHVLTRFMNIDRYMTSEHKVYWCTKVGDNNA